MPASCSRSLEPASCLTQAALCAEEFTYVRARTNHPAKTTMISAQQPAAYYDRAKSSTAYPTVACSSGMTFSGTQSESVLPPQPAWRVSQPGTKISARTWPASMCPRIALSRVNGGEGGRVAMVAVAKISSPTAASAQALNSVFDLASCGTHYCTTDQCEMPHPVGRACNSRIASPAPLRLARRISEYLRERITPGAPARKAASTASFTLCGVHLL